MSVTNTKTRSKSSKADHHWSTMREVGTLSGLRFLWTIHRWFGRTTVSILLRPVVLYFVLFQSQARQASRSFLTAHWLHYPDQWHHKPNIIDTLRHFREFAESVVDKLMAWHLELDQNHFHIRDKETHRRLLEDKRGQLIIGSHLGNIEYCRGFINRYRTHTINVLLNDKHAQNFVEMMRRLNPDSRVNVFQVNEFDITTILLFKEKIEAGEWIFIAGDRIPLSGVTRTATVKFLGRETQLPIGPYLLGRALGCPVKLMFAYKNYCGNDNRLYFDIIDFAEQIKLPAKQKSEKLEQLAQLYANELENICRQAPFQWFNFYPYWQSHTESTESTP